MAVERVGAGVAGNRAQDEGDHDGVVGVADDRHEVGDDVDRGGQVHQQQHQPDSDPGGHGLVGGEAADESQQVGQQL